MRPASLPVLLLLACVTVAAAQGATLATGETPPPVSVDDTPMSLSVATGSLTGTMSTSTTLSPPASVDPVVVPLFRAVSLDADLSVEKSGLQVDGDLSMNKDSMLFVPRMTLSDTAKVLVTSTPRIRTGSAQPVQMAPFVINGTLFLEGPTLIVTVPERPAAVGTPLVVEVMQYGSFGGGPIGKAFATASWPVIASDPCIQLGTPTISIGASVLLATIPVSACPTSAPTGPASESSALSREAIIGIAVGSVVAGAAVAAIFIAAMVASRRRRDAAARMWAVARENDAAPYHPL